MALAARTPCQRRLHAAAAVAGRSTRSGRRKGEAAVQRCTGVGRTYGLQVICGGQVSTREHCARCSAGWTLGDARALRAAHPRASHALLAGPRTALTATLEAKEMLDARQRARLGACSTRLRRLRRRAGPSGGLCCCGGGTARGRRLRERDAAAGSVARIAAAGIGSSEARRHGDGGWEGCAERSGLRAKRRSRWMREAPPQQLFAASAGSGSDTSTAPLRRHRHTQSAALPLASTQPEEAEDAPTQQVPQGARHSDDSQQYRQSIGR